MSQNAATLPRTRVSPALRFLLVFALTCALGIGFTFVVLTALEPRRLLPVPPVTATWRNLDMKVFEERLTGSKALNAASCYLHIDQTAFLTSFLFERLPRLDTLVVVLAPRDFKDCRPDARAFFDPMLAGAFVDGVAPSWLVQLLGVRPVSLVREVIRLQRANSRAAARAVEDSLGSSIIRNKGSFWPAPAFDDRCHPWLTSLEAMAQERGVHLGSDAE